MGPRAAILVAVLLLATSVPAADDEKNELVLPLEVVKLEKGRYRPGYRMKGPLPETALAWCHASGTWLFLDLNGDGKITPDGADGLALQKYPFVVPLPRVLLLPEGQGTWIVGKKSLSLMPEDVGVSARLLKGAILVSELRIRAGLPPLPVDAAASRACAAHLDYLKRNRQTSGMSLHDEDPDRPGYTVEGAAAGQGSSLAPGATSFEHAVDWWYTTAWHSAPLFSPSLTGIGVGLRHGIAMLYYVGYQLPEQPVHHPPDGAAHVPLAFAERGELPNPTPHRAAPKGCGFPIMMILPYGMQGRVLSSAKVTDSSGKALAGTHSCPARPATKLWPTNSGAALFIPEHPLRKNETYRVEFRFEDSAKPVVWRFSTGEAPPAAAPARLKSDTLVRRILRGPAAPLKAENRDLREILVSLSAIHVLPIHLEKAAAERLEKDPGVTCDTTALPLNDLIGLLCRQKGLTHRVRRGALWIRCR